MCYRIIGPEANTIQYYQLPYLSLIVILLSLRRSTKSLGYGIICSIDHYLTGPYLVQGNVSCAISDAMSRAYSAEAAREREINESRDSSFMSNNILWETSVDFIDWCLIRVNSMRVRWSNMRLEHCFFHERVQSTCEIVNILAFPRPNSWLPTTHVLIRHHHCEHRVSLHRESHLQQSR